MPESYMYSPNSNNTKWSLRADTTKGLGKGVHAEEKLYRNHGIYSVILFRQDAFPCSNCDQYFISKTLKNNNLAIAFEVTKDGSGDRNHHVLNHGLPVAAIYPCVIYYFRGQVSYNQAPVNWPVTPAI